MFELHPQLAADTVSLGNLPLCQVLLMNEAQYPWLILVPRRSEIREAHELEERDWAQLQNEVLSVSKIIMAHTEADKLNTAALGNLVPQLHVHIIARFKHDAAWPKPVWGLNPSKNYTPHALEDQCRALSDTLLKNEPAFSIQ